MCREAVRDAGLTFAAAVVSRDRGSRGVTLLLLVTLVTLGPVTL